MAFLLFQPIFHLFRISPAGNGERHGFAWEKIPQNAQKRGFGDGIAPVAGVATPFSQGFCSPQHKGNGAPGTFPAFVPAQPSGSGRGEELGSGRAILGGNRDGQEGNDPIVPMAPGCSSPSSPSASPGNSHFGGFFSLQIHRFFLKIHPFFLHPHLSSLKKSIFSPTNPLFSPTNPSFSLQTLFLPTTPLFPLQFCNDPGVFPWPRAPRRPRFQRKILPRLLSAPSARGRPPPVPSRANPGISGAGFCTVRIFLPGAAGMGPRGGRALLGPRSRG